MQVLPKLEYPDQNWSVIYIGDKFTSSENDLQQIMDTLYFKNIGRGIYINREKKEAIFELYKNYPDNSF